MQKAKEGVRLGKLGYVYAFMLKYVTPMLIAVIEIFGIIDIVAPVEGGGRVFSIEGLIVTLTAYAILLVTVAAYFIFFKNKNSGTNEGAVSLPEE